MNRRLFWRFLFRALYVRRAASLATALALLVLATVSAALLSLRADLNANVSHEFGRLGPNILITAKDRGELPLPALGQVRNLLPAEDVAVPYAYAVASAPDGSRVVVAGTDIALARLTHKTWDILVIPNEGDIPLVGKRVNQRILPHALENGVTLKVADRAWTFRQAGIVSTGGPEDDMVFVPISDFVTWTGVKPSLIEVAATGTREQVDADIVRLRSSFPQMEVNPVRQFSQAEVRILERTHSIFLISGLIIAALVSLSVLATLTASLLERRKDFAVMKALGSGQALINALFLSESLTLALLASLLGTAVGYGIAVLIGKFNFNAAITVHWMVLPQVVILSALIALVGSALPLVRLHKLQPADMLKGE